MRSILHLNGKWELLCDPAPCQRTAPPPAYPDVMLLPGTTAQQKIGTPNTACETGYLTEVYPFEGQIWLRKTVALPKEMLGCHLTLTLNRTRMTALWVNGCKAGCCDSLCAPHCYDLTPFAHETMELVLCVKNTDYPTRGGHMTSPDTQTNWIGVTGDITLTASAALRTDTLRTYPDATEKTVALTGILHGALQTECIVTAESFDKNGIIRPLQVLSHHTLRADVQGKFTLALPMPDAPLWSEYNPVCIRLMLTLPESDDTAEVTFGMRNFTANGDHFEINGSEVMLRGKHDGLVFPIEGAAPTDVESWLRIFAIAKAWGINHYRFHTCCPPEACFAAADLMGIYMEPELPFWGTVHAPDDKDFRQEEQEYLICEGLRIADAYGNHPSFCMFSLGNELWGSPERLTEIIARLKANDSRPLYTQGSNNFQHMPLQVPNEDFWTGVRLGWGKLIRGSYATCDAPIGLIQTAAPSTAWDYEALLTPQYAESTESGGEEAEIEIQYGTGVKKVRAAKTEGFCPDVPVVTHEVGQYAVYPDFSEIEKYTGVLQARNFEIFRKRLETAGMLAQAEDFFRCSGKLSRDCYKMEIEAAMRSPHVAGFQLLDLQDFPGQGTALVGMLNALMENKGFIQPEAWRGFCGDCVPLARFDSFVWTAGTEVSVGLGLRNYRPNIQKQTLHMTLTCTERLLAEAKAEISAAATGYCDLGNVGFTLSPDMTGKAVLTLTLTETGITNRYDITILSPAKPVIPQDAVSVVHTMADALPLLQKGNAVLMLPATVAQSIPGFYCTDFWCYPMFRSISESMNKEVPVGTMGLCIQAEHPIAKVLYSEEYTTPQWYTPVSHADCAILDAAPEGFRPIVQMIDNFERNHRLGLIFEARVGGGRLLVSTIRTEECPDDAAMSALAQALTDYAASPAFAPEAELDARMLAEILC
ncbi:MAG: beta-glucuronidase [Ruminococcus sp.]|nr:beta-glucuronidase [Ruminococcus sp.]